MTTFKTYLPNNDSVKDQVYIDLDQLRGTNDDNSSYISYLFGLDENYQKILGIFDDSPLFMLFYRERFKDHSHIKIAEGQGLAKPVVREISKQMGMVIDETIEYFHLVQANNNLYYNMFDLVEGLTFDQFVSFTLGGRFTFNIPDHITFNQGFGSHVQPKNAGGISGYSVGSHVTVKADFTYENIKSLGSNFKVDGILYVRRLDKNPFVIGESSACQEVDINVSRETRFGLDIKPISLQNLTVAQSIKISGGTINHLSDLHAPHVSISCNVTNLSNVSCGLLELKYVQENVENCEADIVHVYNGYIKTFPNIKISTSLIVDVNSDPIKFEHPLNLTGDLILKTHVHNLPKNSLIMGKTVLANSSVNRINIPESFCCLGGIEY